MLQRLKNKLFAIIDLLFVSIDKKYINRANNIHYIPSLKHRKGGKTSYAEWAHVIGIFQTIFFDIASKKSGNKILDIGCGTGLLGIASKNLIQDGGKYTGIDVIRKDIEFNKQHYDPGTYDFIHFDLANPTYAEKQSSQLKPWPVEKGHYDLVTALSVWTHLKENEAKYYFKEVERVLKPDGKAVITFFILDEDYKNTLSQRTSSKGRYHNTSQSKWIFDNKAYESENWWCPKWVKYPEDAIGVTLEGLDELLNSSGLKLLNHYRGNWKEIPGVYFQDVLVLGK